MVVIDGQYGVRRKLKRITLRTPAGVGAVSVTHILPFPGQHITAKPEFAQE